MGRVTTWVLLGCAFLSLALVSCGSDEPQEPHTTSVAPSEPAPEPQNLTSEPTDNPSVTVMTVKLKEPFIVSGENAEAEILMETADSDSVLLDYRWFVNGEEVLGVLESVLPPEHFKRGDRVTLQVRSRDSRGIGPWQNSPEYPVVNGTPRILSLPEAADVTEGYVYQVRAVDPDEDALIYSLDKAPEGATIDPSSGRLQWAPSADQVGEFTITVRATDPEGAYSVQEYTLAVSQDAAKP